MLVFDRFEGEALVINENITVRILRKRGHENNPDYIPSKVRIGIEAPKEIPVHREGIQQAIDREKSLDRTAVK